MVVIPRGKVHGFVCLTNVEIELVGVPKMGQWVMVLEADGATQEVEWRDVGHLWRRERVGDDGTPSNAEMWRLAETTRHLL